MDCFALSTINETGCSGRFARESRSVLAGTAMLPESFDSTFRDVVMVVSISLAETTSSPLLSSKRKQTRIGMVLLVLSTPPIDFKCLSNADADTTKFINEGV